MIFQMTQVWQACFYTQFVINQSPTAWKSGLKRKSRQRLTEEQWTHTAIHLPGCRERMLHSQIRKLSSEKNNKITHHDSRQNTTKVNREPERHIFFPKRQGNWQADYLAETRTGFSLAYRLKLLTWPCRTSGSCLQNTVEIAVMWDII